MIIVLDRSIDLPVPIEDIREHCRAPANGDDDNLLRRYAGAAISFIETQTSRVMVPTTFEERFSCWSVPIRLGRTPVRDVISVSYLDHEGTLQTVSGTDYRWDRTPEGAAVNFIQGYSFPSLASDREGVVRIEYEAGTDVEGTSGSGLDPDLVSNNEATQAMLFLLSHWYETREPVNMGNIVTGIPFTAESLLSHLRVFR